MTIKPATLKTIRYDTASGEVILLPSGILLSPDETVFLLESLIVNRDTFLSKYPYKISNYTQYLTDLLDEVKYGNV